MTKEEKFKKFWEQVPKLDSKTYLAFLNATDKKCEKD